MANLKAKKRRVVTPSPGGRKRGSERGVIRVRAEGGEGGHVESSWRVFWSAQILKLHPCRLLAFSENVHLAWGARSRAIVHVRDIALGDFRSQILFFSLAPRNAVSEESPTLFP